MLSFLRGNSTKKTELTTIFSIDSKIDEPNAQGERSVGSTMESNSLREVQFAYGVITKQLEIVKVHNTNYTISISIKGLLDGEQVDRQFQDIDLYRQYLEEKNVISKSYIFKI